MKTPFFLILGHARHGKDTFADAVRVARRDAGGGDLYVPSSSMFACELLVFPALREQYGYATAADCFEDRVNHRAEWFDLIGAFNQDDPTRLARAVRDAGAAGYIGMRSKREYAACLDARLFTHVVWVSRPDLPPEPITSFDIPLMWAIDYADACGAVPWLVTNTPGGLPGLAAQARRFDDLIRTGRKPFRGDAPRSPQ